MKCPLFLGTAALAFIGNSGGDIAAVNPIAAVLVKIFFC
jgi:hypothetical protein